MKPFLNLKIHIHSSTTAFSCRASFLGAVGGFVFFFFFLCLYI
ncbi:unnamed protein product, partial [Vitis vinifera]